MQETRAFETTRRGLKCVPCAPAVCPLLVVAFVLGAGIALVPLTGVGLRCLAVLAPVVAIWTALWSAGRMGLLSAATVFTVLYVALTHVGSVLYYLERPDENANFLLMSSLALISFAVGNYLPAISGRTYLRRLTRALPVPRNDLMGHRLQGWRAFAALGVVAGLFLLWGGSRSVGGVPIIGLLQGAGSSGVRGYAESRLDFSRVPGQGYVFNLHSVVLPVATLAFGMRMTQSPSHAKKIVAILLGVLTVVVAAAAGYRGQLAVLALMVIVGLSYYRGTAWSRAGRRILLATMLMIGTISSLVYTPEGPSSSVGNVLLVRIFKVQALGPQYIYRAAPRDGPFSGGAELTQDLAGVLPGRQEGLSSQLPALRGVRSLNNPIGVPAELYLNFGPYGLVIGMLVLGALCHGLHRSLLRSRTIGRIALGAGMTTALGYGALAGITGTLFQYGVVAVMVMAGTLALFDLPARQRSRPYRHATAASEGVGGLYELPA